MSIVAHSMIVTTSDSFATGREVGSQLVAAFVELPRLVLTYLTANHDHGAFLRGMVGVLGDNVKILGCSVQGVIGKGIVREEGFGAAVLGLGGDSLQLAVARVDDIHVDTEAKGRLLGSRLRAQSTGQPKATVLLFDPLSGANFQALLNGLAEQVQCPILGGAAAAPFAYGELQETHQYFGSEVFSRGAVAFTLGGDIHLETELCHGCSPVGVEMRVTKAEGNVLVELDGRRAADMWDEICGDAAESGTIDRTPALAIGVPAHGTAAGCDYFVLAAFTTNQETGGVTMGIPISEGVTIMLHHRTVEDVMSGARRMADSLHKRLVGRRVHAVLGFECGARTRPFLGDEATLQENLMLQNGVAADAEWIGGMFWGELFPAASGPAFHNYSYPLLVIAE